MRKGIFYILASFVFAYVCFSAVIPVPPTPESLQGIWVGLPYEASDYCRLMLTNKGGVFGRSFEAGKAMVYTVEAFKVDGRGRITVKVSPASTNAFPILVSGTASAHEIRILTKSPDGGWSHRSVLYREDTVYRMLEDIRKSMQQFRK